MILTQPTNTEFKQAQQALSNILKEYSAQLDTGKGSTIRELIIRPYAYLYAKVNNFIRDWLNKTSIKYLSASMATQNQTADAIASNYFVQRKQQLRARGVVTVTFNISSASIGSGVVFIIDGKYFRTIKTTIASLSPLQDTDTVDYVKMYPTSDGLYQANVTVQADTAGYIQIPVGVQVACDTYIANAQALQLTSPITGGATAETDASMFKRCKQLSGTCVGTLQAVRHKLYTAPINVLSCSVLGSNQPGCFRARYNNLAIPIGGVVDIYAKTANQASIKDIIFTDIQQDPQTGKYFVQADCSLDTDIAGMLRVLSVISDTQQNLGNYTIYYISGDNTLSQVVSRLSSTQGFRVVFQQPLQAVSTLRVAFQYIPGISELTNFLLQQEQIMLGQDYKLRAAVPAKLSLKLVLKGLAVEDAQLLTDIKQLIAQTVCLKQVGDYRFSVDQITQALSREYPQLKLSLPHNIQVQLPMTTGANYTFNSTDGTVDISFRQQLYTWDSKAYFFSTTSQDIDIQVL